MRAIVTMMPLIDDKGIFQTGQISFICAKQPDKIKFTSLGRLAHRLYIEARFFRHKAHIKTCNARGRTMQDIETIPCFCNNAVGLSNITRLTKHCRAVCPGKRTHANNDHRALRFFQFGGKFMFARRKIGKHRWLITQESRVIGKIHFWPDNTNWQAGGQPVPANACIQHSSLDAWIAADDQQSVRVINASNGRVKEVSRPRSANFGTILPTIDIATAHFAKQCFQREHSLGIDLITCNRRHRRWLCLFHLCRYRLERIIPAGRRKTAVTTPQIRPVKTLAAQPIHRIAGFVRNPFLVDVLIQPGQHTHHLRSTGINTDVTAKRVHHVNGLGLVQLPGSRGKGIGL